MRLRNVFSVILIVIIIQIDKNNTIAVTQSTKENYRKWKTNNVKIISSMMEILTGERSDCRRKKKRRSVERRITVTSGIT